MKSAVVMREQFEYLMANRDDERFGELVALLLRPFIDESPAPPTYCTMAMGG